MEVFVTGGTGLIGSGIVSLFGAHTRRLDVLTRSRKPVNGTNISGDLADPSLDLRPLLKGIDVVVHNAASVVLGKTPDEEMQLEATNVQGTRRVLDAVVATGVRKILFTSSFSFIRKPLPELIVETSDIDPVLPYSKSKLAGEKMIEEYAVKYGLQYNILRVSSPISFDFSLMPNNVVKAWITQSRDNQVLKVFGDGSRAQDFVAVEDIAQAFLAAARSTDVNGVLNIASGTTVSMLDLARMMTAKFGNQFELVSSDNAEKWNISIERAERLLKYRPHFTAQTAVSELLSRL
jgi:UDP-glucose 4-epimerase